MLWGNGGGGTKRRGERKAEGVFPEGGKTRLNTARDPNAISARPVQQYHRTQCDYHSDYSHGSEPPTGATAAALN
eukprot:2892453-Rhodomonas_salina.1